MLSHLLDSFYLQAVKGQLSIPEAKWHSMMFLCLWFQPLQISGVLCHCLTLTANYMVVLFAQELVKEDDDEVSDKGSESDEDDTNRDSLSEKDDGSDRDSDREQDEKQSKDDEAVRVTFHCMMSLSWGWRISRRVSLVGLHVWGKCVV